MLMCYGEQRAKCSARCSASAAGTRRLLPWHSALLRRHPEAPPAEFEMYISPPLRLGSISLSVNDQPLRPCESSVKRPT